MNETFESIKKGLNEAIDFSQGKLNNKPKGPALVLLNLVKKDPQAVLRLLSVESS
jgi:hypothetical protein